MSKTEKKSDFVHLHVHTDYSLLDGACRIDRLMNRATELGMPAVSITDHGNLFGLVDFYRQAKKFEVKPLLGCELYLTTDSRLEKPERSKAKAFHMGMLAKSYQGYQNLTKLVSDAHVKGMYYKPRADLETLSQFSEGLIGFTGCLQGVVPQALLKSTYEDARKWVGTFVDILGKENYFVEIQDHQIPEQLEIIPGLLKLAKEFDLKVVCTNDVHYVKKDDASTHDALLCIQTGSKVIDEKRMRYANDNFYLKSEEEMAQIFKEHPESLTNTVHVAEMCEMSLPFGENHYPVYNPPIELKDRYKDNFEHLHDLCVQGLKKRYDVDYQNPDSYEEKESDPKGLAKTLVERIDYELSIIKRTGFIDYFLIVQDFIAWAIDEEIPVGPGRGSGAGCIVAYLTNITDIDPIRFGLLFERFLNPERVSPPDFDIDFCMRRRDRVVDYVRNKYGQDCVANIITFGKFGAKMVVRDVARVLDLPYADADRLAKMVPDDLNITLNGAIEKSNELAQEVQVNNVAAKIMDHGKIIEGMVRNTGKHACGIIIGDRPLDEFIPLTLQEGDLTTQYPKEPVEDLGLLKMDFLGLKTLTVIDDAQTNVRQTVDPNFDIKALGFEDQKTFDLLNSGKTVGVFQLESGGMQNLCRQFKISSIDEIIALIALYRPGPMDLIPDYIRGKHNPSTVKYPHPLLEDVCRETYGIMVYQEQVMEAARIIAGYSLGGADILRRAMGKKKVEEMDKQRAIFIKGAKDTHNIAEKKAREIFALLEKFAGYGFNKSHSAAYGILSYHTAYLKANYPVQFMAAILSSELGNADKVANFIKETEAMGIRVQGPCVNRSREAFTPVVNKGNESDKEEGSILFGLGAIKGVGDVAAQKIIEERNENGDYENFQDFVHRVDTRSVNKRVLENLSKTGAFDFSKEDRGILLQNCESVLAQAADLAKDREAGQANFFDMMSSATESAGANDNGYDPLQGTPMEMNDKLQHEKELLGFYISGHPLDAFAGLDNAISTFEGDEYTNFDARTSYRLCGVVSLVEKKISKRDNRPWAIMHLGTKIASYEMMVYSDAFESFGHLLETGTTIIVNGLILRRDEEVRLGVESIQSLAPCIPHIIQEITWILRTDDSANDFLKKLRHSLDSYVGNTEMRLGFQMEDGNVAIAEIAGSLTWKPTPQLFKELRKHPAVIGTRVSCPPPVVEDKPTWKRNKKEKISA